MISKKKLRKRFYLHVQKSRTSTSFTIEAEFDIIILFYIIMSMQPHGLFFVATMMYRQRFKVVVVTIVSSLGEFVTDFSDSHAIIATVTRSVTRF